MRLEPHYGVDDKLPFLAGSLWVSVTFFLCELSVLPSSLLRKSAASSTSLGSVCCSQHDRYGLGDLQDSVSAGWDPGILARTLRRIFSLLPCGGWLGCR